jgi:hypothetical protein
MCGTIHYPDLAAQAARPGSSPWYFNLCNRLETPYSERAEELHMPELRTALLR